MDNKELIISLRDELAIPLTDEENREQLRSVLASYVNEMLEKNFERLVSVLYRLDINENKLRQLLKDKVHEDAGLLIADLIIERQIQKINSRKQFKKPGNSIDDEEKW